MSALVLTRGSRQRSTGGIHSAVRLLRNFAAINGTTVTALASALRRGVRVRLLSDASISLHLCD